MSETDMPDGSSQTGVIITATSDLSFRTVSRRVGMYYVTASELKALAAQYTSLNLTLFGVCLGLFPTLLITLITVQIDNSRLFAGFVGTALASFFLSVFFFFQWRKDRKCAEQMIDRIRSGLD